MKIPSLVDRGFGAPVKRESELKNLNYSEQGEENYEDMISDVKQIYPRGPDYADIDRSKSNERNKSNDKSRSKSNDSGKIIAPENQYSHAVQENIYSSYKAAKQKKGPKKKPVFAMTEDQFEKEEDMECDELCDFMDNLNVDDYLGDLELKNMVGTLKKRVNDLQCDSEFMGRLKNDISRRVQKHKENELKRGDIDDDMKTMNDHNERNSGAVRYGGAEFQSAGSSKTQGKFFFVLKK